MAQWKETAFRAGLVIAVETVLLSGMLCCINGGRLFLGKYRLQVL